MDDTETWVVKGNYRWKPWWLFVAGFETSAVLNEAEWYWKLWCLLAVVILLWPERVD